MGKKINLLKIASVALPVVCAIAGFLSDRVSEQQRRAEISQEISAEIERMLADKI